MEFHSLRSHQHHRIKAKSAVSIAFHQKENSSFPSSESFSWRMKKKKFSTRDLELQIAHSSRPRYELALFANSQSKIDGNFSTFFSLKGFRFVTSLVVPVSALDASQTKKNPIGDERRSAHEILSHSPKRALWCMQNCSKSKNRNWLILFRFFCCRLFGGKRSALE